MSVLYNIEATEEIQNGNLFTKYQGRAVDPRTSEQSGFEVPTPELFWGWILFWDRELSSVVVSPNAMMGQLCTHTFVYYNYSAYRMSFLLISANKYLGQTNLVCSFNISSIFRCG